MKRFKIVAWYLAVLLIGAGIVQAGSMWLDYTDELNTTKAEAEYWRETSDALLSRGEWKCTDYQKNNGRCTYRFVPNSKRIAGVPMKQGVRK